MPISNSPQPIVRGLLPGLWGEFEFHNLSVETEFWNCGWARELPLGDQVHLLLEQLQKFCSREEICHQVAMGLFVFILPMVHSGENDFRVRPGLGVAGGTLG